jgi:hypothetical protein
VADDDNVEEDRWAILTSVRWSAPDVDLTAGISRPLHLLLFIDDVCMNAAFGVLRG